MQQSAMPACDMTPMQMAIAMTKEEWRLFFQFNLRNVDNGRHDKTILASIMAKQLPKCAPVLGPTILQVHAKLWQPSSCTDHSCSIRARQPLADSISKVALSGLHSILQSFLQSNLSVRKSATRKRTIQPHSVSGLD